MTPQQPGQPSGAIPQMPEAPIADSTVRPRGSVAGPPAWPADTSEVVAQVRRDGEAAAATPLAFNCSGKHAGFLAACAASGHDVATYLDPAHPLQRLVRMVTGRGWQHPARVPAE